MSRLLVMADGPDAPGIVANVTSALAELGCNLEDTSMTRLGGRFVMLLIVQAPDEIKNEFVQRLNLQRGERPLSINVHPLEDDVNLGQSVDGEHWAVSVYGSDHPGIVASIASALADAGANIDDLSTRVIGDADSPTYTMLIDVTVPADADSDTLEAQLHQLGEELGVTCRVHRVDADTL